jgi:hypothetical protein
VRAQLSRRGLTLQHQEIIERLRPTLEKEGVKLDVLRVNGDQLEVRARRTAPGVPIAFLVKAIEGTFKRYHSEIKEVLLLEYDPGENLGKPARNPEFDKVLHANTKVDAPVPVGWLGLDLTGLDRASAVRALEQAHRVFTGRSSHEFLVRGLRAPEVRAAFDKWQSFYQLARQVHACSDDVVAVYLDESERGFQPEDETLWMPGRILLVESPGPA